MSYGIIAAGKAIAQTDKVVKCTCTFQNLFFNFKRRKSVKPEEKSKDLFHEPSMLSRYTFFFYAAIRLLNRTHAAYKMALFVIPINKKSPTRVDMTNDDDIQMSQSEMILI